MNLQHPEKILELEFKYIENTAAQSVEDRYRMLNFYIGLVTTVATLNVGILSLVGEGAITQVTTLVGGLFVIIALIGWLFLAMMIRLRQAWMESIKGLNHIKDYFVSNSDLNLDSAFLWKSSTVPKAYKVWSIHFYSSLLIILLDSFALGAGIYTLALKYIMGGNGFALSAIGILLSIGGQIVFYRVSLRDNS